MSETPTADGEGWRFWAAVRAEMRATWWGRWRWLWMALGVACIGVSAVFGAQSLRMDRDLLDGASSLPWLTFQVFLLIWFPSLLYGLMSWPAAWLGSDLLSIAYAGNPDQLREWRPTEFLARFVGRLGPLLGVVGTSALIFSLGYRREPPDWLSASTLFVALYFSMGLSHAAAAALVSSLSRRPRRRLITALVMFASFLPCLGLLSRDEPDWLVYAAQDGLRVWISLAATVQSWPLMGGEYLQSHWVIVSVLLGVAIIAGSWTWWIAARRYRRSRRLA